MAMHTPRHRWFVLLRALESGQAVGHLVLSLSATAVALLVIYYAGSYLAEDMREWVWPAFNWQ